MREWERGGKITRKRVPYLIQWFYKSMFISQCNTLFMCVYCLYSFVKGFSFFICAILTFLIKHYNNLHEHASFKATLKRWKSRRGIINRLLSGSPGSNFRMNTLSFTQFAFGNHTASLYWLCLCDCFIFICSSFVCLHWFSPFGFDLAIKLFRFILIGLIVFRRISRFDFKFKNF